MVVYATDVQISERLKGVQQGTRGRVSSARPVANPSNYRRVQAFSSTGGGRSRGYRDTDGRVIVIAQEQIAAIVEPPGTATAGADRA